MPDPQGKSFEVLATSEHDAVAAALALHAKQGIGAAGPVLHSAQVEAGTWEVVLAVEEAVTVRLTPAQARLVRDLVNHEVSYSPRRTVSRENLRRAQEAFDRALASKAWKCECGRVTDGSEVECPDCGCDTPVEDLEEVPAQALG